MSYLLEILGRGIALNIADLIVEWINGAISKNNTDETGQYESLEKYIKLLSKNKVDAAAGELRVYIFENSHCVLGKLAVAAIYLHKGRIQAAMEELLDVYRHQPSNTMALYALGHCYERLGDDTCAKQYYQDCLKFKRYLEFPCQRLAAIYLKNLQYDDAIAQYEILGAEYPANISLLVSLGHLYIAAKRYEEAIETFNRALLIHPDNFQFGNDSDIDELIEENRIGDAMERIDEMLAEQPERLELIMKRADILSMTGDFNESINQYEQVVQKCPDFLEAMIKLGTQYLHTNQPSEAAIRFNNALEINDKIVDAYIGLCKAQYLSKKESEAMQTLSLAGSIQANSYILFAHTAALSAECGIHYKLANNELINQVVTAHCRQLTDFSDDPNLNYRIGLLMRSLGKTEEAVESFKNVLKINPMHMRAATKLCLCMFESGQINQAMEKISSENTFDKKTISLHYKIAMLYCDQLRFASALLNLEAAMADNYAFSGAAYNVETVLQNLGLIDRVTAMWEELQETTHRLTQENS